MFTKAFVSFLIIASFPVMSDMYLGAGVVASRSGNELGKMYHFGWEQDKRHPFVAHFAHVTEYEKSNHYVEARNMVSAGKQWQYDYNSKWQFYGKIGLMAYDRKTYASPLHWGFYETIGAKYDRYRVYIRHTSNANMKKPNVGENTLMFAIDF